MSHSCPPSASPFRYPLIESPEPWIKPNRSLTTLHRHPAELLITWRGGGIRILSTDWNIARQLHTRHVVLLFPELADVTDFGENEYRGEVFHPSAREADHAGYPACWPLRTRRGAPIPSGVLGVCKVRLVRGYGA